MNTHVALAQIAPRLGDLDANIEKHLAYIQRELQRRLESKGFHR